MTPLEQLKSIFEIPLIAIAPDAAKVPDYLVMIKPSGNSEHGDYQANMVITDNHLGDWGTQFGMLIYGYRNYLDAATFAADPVRELNRVYVEVRKAIGGDDEEAVVNPIAEACRQETAKLHAGDPENVAL